MKSKTTAYLTLPKQRFCVGDKFYLCENKILCEYDFEERLSTSSMSSKPSTL